MERKVTLFYNGTQRQEGTKNYFRTQRRRDAENLFIIEHKDTKTQSFLFFEFLSF